MSPSNVLFLNSDQHSPHVLGAYGNAVVRTPHLDALAASGTRFAQAYCSTPVCVPSRASLATGRYAHALGSWDNAAPYTGREARSWGHRLTDAGHRVTTIGKLHYRSVDDPTGFPDQRLPIHVFDGTGDVYGLLRKDMPVRPQGRKEVLDAAAGESEYTRFDRAVTTEAVRWLTTEATAETQPWALFVSWVNPHFPLRVPEGYLRPYPPDALPFPVQGRATEWPHHPVLDFMRWQQRLDEPFDEATLHRAMAVYYGMVTFLDEQIGAVLDALDATGLRERTRVIYASDHGEMLGEHGLWFKSVMYEASVGVPLILAGPDVPQGIVTRTNVSLIDVYPTVLEAMGVAPAAEDCTLPGTSLLGLATTAPERDRTVFSEYHAIFSPSGMFMVRNARYKYVHYVGDRPQLFDMLEDPDETHDLGQDPALDEMRTVCERELRRVVDPEEIDHRARADQQRRIEAAGGKEAILRAGVTVPYTPAPPDFSPIHAQASRGAVPPSEPDGRRGGSAS